MDPLLVITNAEAGTTDAESLSRALAVLREHASVEVHSTGNPGELDSVLHRAGARRIVVAGGDGSLHAVVAALHRRNELKSAVLALLPLGTGNDFARGVGLPLDIEAAAQVALHGRVVSMDVLVDELGEVVVNAVHVGAGAQASRRAHRWKERLGRVGPGSLNLGRLGYPIGALLTAWRPPVLRLRVQVDDEVVNDLDRPVLMVAVGNGPSVGGGTELTPEAEPADGQLDVLVSRAVTPRQRWLYGIRLGLGRHHRASGSSYRRGSQVSIAGGPFWVSVDGEIAGPERQRTWRVETGAYSLVLPA